MNVVWLVSNYPNNQNFISGIFYKRMAETLASQGVNISVLALTPYSNLLLGKISSKWQAYFQHPDFEFKNGVKIYWPRYIALPGQNNYTSTPYLMYHAIKNHLVFKDADIIDAHYAFPFGYLGRLLSRKFNIPYIVSFRGSDVNVDANRSFKAKQNFINSVSKSSAQIAVSEALAAEAKRLSGIGPVVVNVGINLSNEKRIRFPKNKGVFTFIFVGALTREKGLHLIERLLKENFNCKSYSWIIIGEGPFKKLLSKFSNVTVLGAIPHDRVLEYMIEADLMVFPSLNEGMPNVLKEAGSVSLPIVASDVGGIPDLLNFGERGEIFESDNYDKFKSSVYHSIFSYNIMLEKARLLQNHIYKNYDLNINAQKLICVYRKILKRDSCVA